LSSHLTPAQEHGLGYVTFQRSILPLTANRRAKRVDPLEPRSGFAKGNTTLSWLVFGILVGFLLEKTPQILKRGSGFVGFGVLVISVIDSKPSNQ
jgi:hypothetical protein